MMGLRLAGGIDAASFARRFGEGCDGDPARAVGGVGPEGVGRGALPRPAPEASMRLSPAGLMLLDHLLGEAADRISAETPAELEVKWP